MREMKDSGVEWIGKIPKHKQVLRNKYLFEYVKGKLPQSTNLNGVGFPYIGASNLNTNNNYTTFTIDEELPNAEYNDLLVLWDGARAGLCGTHKIGKISSTVVRIRANKTVFLPFLYWYYKSFESYMYQSVNGTTIPHMNRRYIEQIGFINWEATEQHHISDYLDNKCAKIDAIISNEKSVIEKLKEYKQSVITETVTKGLNSNVKMKDSGIEWIGKIPENWDISRIKYNTYLKGRIGWQGLKANEFIDEGPYLITGTDFENGKVNWEKCYHISYKRYMEAPDIHLKEKDLLITKDGTVGKLAYLNLIPFKASLNSHLLVIRPTTELFTNLFLYWVFSSKIFKIYTGLSQNGTIMESLSQEKINNFSFPLPPIINQKAITEQLDQKCSKIESAIKKKQSVIDKLTEYKKSLIYEVVTGKKEI